MAAGRFRRFISRPLFSDFRFWLILYFIIRLYNITQPPLEIAHSWRQCTGLMVSRNFYEVDPNIFYPRVDMAGDKTGITGTEFPLFNYLIYLFAKVFGWADWYGRFINLVVSSFGVYWFYLLIARYFNRKMAFYAGFILLNSLWFAYSRKTMPDTFSLALTLGGLYYGLDYLYEGKFRRLLLFFLLGLCGILSKIPAGYILVVLAIPFLDKEVPIVRKAAISLAFIALMVPVCWWYFIRVPYLVKEYGFWHYYMGTSMGNGAHEIATHLDQAVEKFYFRALNYIGFGLFVIGLVLAFVKKEKRLLMIFGLCFAAFFVFMLKAGFAFYHHNYYIIPFVPVMAMVVGYTLSMIPKLDISRVLMLAVATEVILNALPEFRTNSDERYKLGLEPLAAKYTAKNDLIAINCGPNPQQIYLAHRKGWNLENDSETTVHFITSIRDKGCRVLIVNKHEPALPPYPWPKLEENQDFIVYKLR